MLFSLEFFIPAFTYFPNDHFQHIFQVFPFSFNEVCYFLYIFFILCTVTLFQNLLISLIVASLNLRFSLLTTSKSYNNLEKLIFGIFAKESVYSFDLFFRIFLLKSIRFATSQSEIITKSNPKNLMIDNKIGFGMSSSIIYTLI